MLPWLEVFRRSSAGTSPLVMALATVDAAGAPRVRSVVCRNVDDDGSLLFTIDGRSEKHAHLVRDPRAEAVCWLPTVREQFRFNGVADLIGEGSADEARAAAWRSLPPTSKAVFLWPLPGAPRELPDDRFPQRADLPAPPPGFELLLFRPPVVERLELTPHPHRRTRWRKDDGWSCEQLNP
jgi:pyridoxamine 5'-phosphate oxidase